MSDTSIKYLLAPLRDALPYDLVVSYMEEKGFFPKIILEFIEELSFSMSILMFRDRSSHKKINDVREPRSVTR